MEKQDPERLKFQYIKNQDFRSHYADGVIGGSTITGMIDLNFFIERGVIPKEIIFTVARNDMKEVERNGIGDLVREVNTGVIVSLTTAKSIHNWLGDVISELENAILMEK